jgi:UDP-N-acetylglucosamine--N-acetylmuramyl-(pentapeptide) pyrophosphoryl-undecaprenol N-acetylglucosamine transferase
MHKKRKILIAAGGTGGHLFPAQALACDLQNRDSDLELLFAGGGLSSNRCFQKDLFSFKEVFAATPYLKINSLFPSLYTIAKGVRQSFEIIDSFQPDLIVGFGSYHAFPLLLAGLFKKVPMVLFEPNSAPGKVNRLFSRWAKVSAVQFSQAAMQLYGKTLEVKMPLWKRESKKNITCEEARAYFCLDPHRFTFLIFGGSQGASAINRLFCEAAACFDDKQFQVIHFTGKQTCTEEIRRTYARLGIDACVKEFEDHMHLAWKAANLVICRSGAATLAEQVAFEVPGILIPYPYATDDHQRKNALFMQNEVKGAIYLDESDLNGEKLYTVIRTLTHNNPSRLGEMREKMRFFKSSEHKQDLSILISSLI